MHRALRPQFAYFSAPHVVERIAALRDRKHAGFDAEAVLLLMLRVDRHLARTLQATLRSLGHSWLRPSISSGSPERSRRRAMG